MTQPDPQASRAVLIGTAQYEHYGSLPGVSANLIALQEELSRPEVWGLTPQDCQVVMDPRDPREMVHPVTEAGREATDVLLVYVAGHGIRDHQGNLLLALPSTERDPATHGYGTVAYEQLRLTVKRARARYRVVILDCCYSGAAINTMGASDASDQTPIEGTYVLASAPATRTAMAPEGEEFTAFTSELITVIREGIPNGDEYLTLDAIFNRVYGELHAKGLPHPWNQDRNAAGSIPLLKNRAVASRSANSPSEYGEVPGVKPGQLYQSRRELSDAYVHRALQAGICGSKHKGGAESIVVSGGYVDDEDHGDVIIYTGHGGRDPNTGRQVADQRPADSGNAALIASITSRYPVRVIRGAAGDPEYSPPIGFSYDGLYTVESYWAKPGRDGFRVLQFRLEKSNDQAPPVAPTGSPEARAGYDLSRWAPVSLDVYRDRRVAASVCRMHSYECQLCGVVLQSPDGLQITPTTHLKSLSPPHHGPDVPENVLCLCPTHRVQLDLGIFTIEDDLTVIDETTGAPVGELIDHPRHKVSPEYIRYHRGLYRQKR
ncbi:caspase, EACC1-associated type [Actinomadura oligospora]|uniref:caspase, EACC1-associated type n=1 Tax=Actinomadura oligospora TaxID=111804 RepID=UPI000685DF54|nr:YDG/SRA domain-containing protein [Actinomadura oligospora]